MPGNPTVMRVTSKRWAPFVFAVDFGERPGKPGLVFFGGQSILTPLSETADSGTLEPDGKGPVRLRVSYRSPEALLGEFTRSVGKGGVAIETRRALALGTRFVFELRAKGVREVVEVFGEVVQITPSDRGKFLLNIRYDPGTDRHGIDAVLRKIFEAHQFEKIRAHPRVPIHLRATEDAPYSPSFLIRDISRGGVGVEIESPSVPRAVVMDAPFLLEVWLSLGTLVLHGEVIWVFAPQSERAKWINPAFGVAFGKLRQDTSDRLDRILTLRGLPPPPWKARISFGMDAVARMP